MVALQTFAPGESPVPSAKLNAIIAALNGTSNTPVSHTAVNDPASFALAVSNRDAGNSKGFVVYAADGATVLLQATKTGVIASPDGAQPAAKLVTTGDTGSVTGTMLAGGSIGDAKLAADVNRYNRVTNGGLERWSRGVGPFTGNVWTADRWQTVLGGTSTLSVVKDTGNVDVGSGTAAALTYVHNAVSFWQQPIEEYLELRGRVVSLSMRVRAGTVGAVQVAVNDGLTESVSSIHTGDGTYQTLTVPNVLVSAVATGLRIYVRLLASATVYVDNVQLVVGSVPTSYLPLVSADDADRCGRYCELLASAGDGTILLEGSATAAGVTVGFPIHFSYTKPIVPTITIVNAWALVNATGPTNAAGASLWGFTLRVTSVAAGQFAARNTNTGNTVIIEANP